MLRKTLLASLLLFLACMMPAAAAAEPPAGPMQVSADQVWPEKAGWIGQKALFLPAKIYQNVSFLFLYQEPTAAISGVDQLSLGKRLFGKTLTIKGLYSLKKDAATEYYWYLAADTGTQVVWLKDRQDKLLADQPFALETEISQEKRQMEQMAALSGLIVWNNRNLVSSFSKDGSAEHLAPLTIHEFHSNGPFSETYRLTLTQEDGSTLDWTVGLGTTPPVYDHKQFYDLLQKSFYLKDPFATHPDWSKSRWTAIKARKVAVGMNQDMVDLSWGAAKQITKGKKGTETWEYPDSRFLFFKDKTLITIKVPKPPVLKDPKDPKDSKDAKDIKNAQDTKDNKSKPSKEKDADDGLMEVLEAGPVEKIAMPDATATKPKESANTASPK